MMVEITVDNDIVDSTVMTATMFMEVAAESHATIVESSSISRLIIGIQVEVHMK